MREQLTQYVNLLFAGVSGADDIRDEILQNTLDRYDDLTSQGKPEAAAYSLAISGIGDISEILGSSHNYHQPAPAFQADAPAKEVLEKPYKKIFRVIAIALYIISPIPLFVLSALGTDFLEIIGLCGTLSIVAVATVLIVLSGKDKARHSQEAHAHQDPNAALYQSIKGAVWAVAAALYLFSSFATHAWTYTWLIFPMAACISGLIKAGLDYKEATKNEQA